MALGDLVGPGLGDAPITKLVAQKFIEHREVPPLKDGDWLRVSSLSALCPREEVLASLGVVIRQDNVDAGLNLIFLHGHALHWALQNRLLSGLGVLMGQWRCDICGEKYGRAEAGRALHLTLCFRPDHCLRCNSQEFTYSELHFRDEEYRLAGHPDGFLRLPRMPGIGIFEGKSIGEKGFWEVKQAPKADHVIQVQAYLWLTGLLWGKILYWNKAGSGTAALKEHLIERDENVIAEVKKMILSIWNGVRSGKVPKRICAHALCPRAQQCALSEACFKTPDEVPAIDADEVEAEAAANG